MKTKKHTPEQIIEKLRVAETLQAQGQTIAQIVQQLGVSEQTYYRWKNKYEGADREAMKRLRDLEKENARLKRIVAEQAIDLSMAKDVIEGKV